MAEPGYLPWMPLREREQEREGTISPRLNETNEESENSLKERDGRERDKTH